MNKIILHRMSEKKIVQHQGVFRKQIDLLEAVALIVSATVGAGVLGIPFIVAQVGVPVGLLYIVVLGLLMMSLNLLLGELSARTQGTFQLAGLAKMYLGTPGKWLMSGLVYTGGLGSLLIYIIGVGQTLTALFGGNPFGWSVFFFSVMAVLVGLGMRTVKVVEFILTIILIAVVLIIAAWSLPHFNVVHVTHFNPVYLFAPYGVILYAFSCAGAMPETHAILVDKDKTFRKAIVYASLVTIVMYVLFAFMVVGVTGTATTQVATIGLGERLGPFVHILGNVFAVISMGTGFLMGAMIMRDSLTWDYKMPKIVSTILVLGLPFGCFLLGVKEFIKVMDFIGGVLLSTELILIALMYWLAKKKGHLKKSPFQVGHSLILLALLLLAFSIGAVYSIFVLF